MSKEAQIPYPNIPLDKWDQKKRLADLKYIRKAYPEIYGDRTVLEITTRLTPEEKADGVERELYTQQMFYKFIVPSDRRKDDMRVSHYRGVTSDGLVMFWEKTEDKPRNINRFSLKKGESLKVFVDLSTPQGLYLLVYWLEHPLVSVYGVENYFTVNPLLEMRIRGNVIKHDFELMNENYAIGNEVLKLINPNDEKQSVVDITNLAAFVGVDTIGLTQAELLLKLLGTKMDGEVYGNRERYRRYMELGSDERDLEIAIAKAIEYKFIQDTGAEGWKLQDGTLLGANKEQVMNYFREKKAALNKLASMVRIHSEKEPQITDVQNLTDNPSEGVRQVKQLAPDKKTVAPKGEE